MEETENSENGPIPKEDPPNPPVKACALCGCSTPAVRCDRCNSQTFCLSCDDMYHRHPKRKLHLRKAVDSIWSSARSPRLRRRTDLPGDPSKIPIPPPRSRKKERHTIGGRMFSRPGFEMSVLGMKSITPPPKDMYSTPKQPKNTMEQTYENETAIVKSQNPSKPEEIYENDNVIQDENRAASAGLSQSPWNSPQSNISPIQVSIPSSTPEILSNGQSFGFPPKPQSKSITDLPTAGGQHMFQHAPHPYPYMHPQMQPPYSHSMAHLNCAQCISSSWSNLMSPHPSPYFHPMSWGPMHPSMGRGATPTAAQGPMKHSHGDLGSYPDPNFPYPYPPGAPYYPNGVPAFDPNTLKEFSLPNPGSAKVRRSPSSTRSSRHAQSIEDLHSTAEAAGEPSEELANTPAPKAQQVEAEEEIRAPVVSNEPWSCLHCTFINPPGIYICQVCCKTSYGNKPPDDDDIRMESPAADHRRSESPMELVNMDAEIMTSKLSNLKRQKVNDDICQDSLETSLENEEAFKVCDTENTTKSPMLTTETQTSTTTKSTDVQTQNLICKTMASSTDSIFPKQEMSVQTEIEMPGHCTVATDPMISSHSMESLMSGMSAPPYHNRRAGWGRGTSYSTQSLYDRGRSRSPLPRSASMYNEAHSLGRDSSLPPEEVLHSWNPAWLMSDPMYYKPHNTPESGHSLAKEDYFDGTWGSMDKLNRRVKTKQAKQQDSHHMPKFHRSLDDLKNVKHQEIIHSQELQFLQTVKEAERCGFSLEDLHVAYLHCGRENPVFWLEDNWSSMIKNVIALAAKYGEDNEENDVGTISLSEAKEALHIHRGDIWDAVTEVIENRQRKILELTVRGNFTQKQISDALTHNEGNVELAYADLFRASNKRHKFILSPGLSEDSEDLSFSVQTEDGDVFTHSKLGKLNVPPDSKSEKKKSDFLTKLSSIRQAQSERRKAREEKELERESTAQELPPVSPLEPSSRLIDERAILQSPETGEISEEGVMADEIPASPTAEIEHLESVEEKMHSEKISKPDTEVKKKDFEEDHLPVDYDANWVDSQGEWIEEYSDEQWDEENDGNWVSLQKKFHNMEKELAEEAMQMAALWEKEELEDDVFEQEPPSVIETHLEESDKLKSEQEEKFQQWVKVNLAKDLSETEEEPVNEEVMSMEVKEPALSKDSGLEKPLEHNLALEEIQSSEQHLNIDLHDANLSKSVEFDDTVISHSPLQHYPTEFDLSSKSFMESDWVEVKSDTNILQEEKQNELIESPPIADELTESENILPDETYYKMQDEYEHEISDGEWEKVDIRDIELLKEASSLQEKEMLSHEEFKLPESVKTEIEEMPVSKVDPHYENKHAESISPKVTENFEDNKPKPPLRRKSKLSALEIQMALMNQPTPIDTDVSEAPPAIPLKAKNKISEQAQVSDLYAVPDKKAKTKSPEPSQLSKIGTIEKEIENVSEIVPPKPPRLAIPQTSSTFSKETSPVTSEFNESDSNCFADSESDPEIKMVRQKMHKKYSRHEFDDELENDQDIRKEKTLEKESTNLGLSINQTGMKQEFDPELPIPIGTRGVQANDDILSPKAFREGSARPLQLFKSSKSESIESTEEKSIDFISSSPLNKTVSDAISTSQDHSYYNTTSKSQTASQLQKQQAIENASSGISDKFMDAYNANYYNINDVNRNKLENDALTISNSNVPPAVVSNLQFPKEELPLEEFPPPTIEPNVSNINEELLFTEMEATSAVADYFFGRYNEVTVAKPKKKVIVKIDKSGMPAMPKPMTASQIKSPTPPVSKSPSMEHSASPVLGVKADPIETAEKETPKVMKPASPLIEKKKVIVPEPVKVPVPTETLSFAEDYFFGSYNEVVPPKKIKTKNIAIQQIPELPIAKTNLPESSVFQGTLSSSDSIEDFQDFQDAQQFMSSMSGSLPSISEVGSMYEDAAENLSMTSYDLEEPIWKDNKDGKGKSVHFEEPQPPIAPPPRRNRGQHVSTSSTALGVGESKLFQTTENPQSIMLAKKKLQPTSEDFKNIQGHDPSEYSCDIPLLPCETPESLLSSEISVESYIDEKINSSKDLSCENVFYTENSKESIDLPVPVFSSDVSDAPVSAQLFDSNSLQSNNSTSEISSSNFDNLTSNLNLSEESTFDQDKNNTIIGYTLDDKDTAPLSEISSQNKIVPLEKDQTISSKENATASLDDSYEEDSFQLVEQSQNIINDFCDLYLHAGFDTPANEVENYNVQNNNQDCTYDSEHEWKLNEERNNSLNATFIENPLYNIASETCSFNIINQDKLIINSEIISDEISKDVISAEEANKTPAFDETNEIIEDLSEIKEDESNSQNMCPSSDLDAVGMEDLETVSDTVQPLTLLCQTAVKSLESSTYQTPSKEELVKELKELLEEIDFSESVSKEDITKAEQVDLSTYDLDSRSSSIQTIISTTLESNADANENIKDEETTDSMVMNEQDSNVDEVEDKIKESHVFNVDQDIQESNIDKLLDDNKMKESDDLSIEQRQLDQDVQESEIDEVSDDNKMKQSDNFNIEQEPLDQEPDLEINKFSTLSETEVDIRLNEQFEHTKSITHTLKDFEIDSDSHSLYETNEYTIECSSETENQLPVCSKNNEEEDYENPEDVNTSSFEKPTSSRELSPVMSEKLLSSLSNEVIDSVEHYPQVNAEEENGEVICINSADEPIEEISIMSHFYEEWFDYVKPSDGTEVKKDLLAVYASYSQSESSATSSANVSVAGDFVEVSKEDVMQASVLNDTVMDDDFALDNTTSNETFIDLEERESLISDLQKDTDKFVEHTPEKDLFDEKLTDISNTYNTLISESTLQHETDEVLNTENSFHSLSFVNEEIVAKDFSTEAISKQQSFRTSKSCQTDDSFEEEQFFDSFDDTFTIPSFIQLPFSKTIAQPIKMEIGIQCSLISEDITKSDEMTSKCFDAASNLKLQGNSIQIQAVFSDDFNEEDSEMISAASSVQQGYQNALDKDMESSGSESLEDSDSDFFVEPHSSQDEADISRKEKKTHKGLLFLDVDSDTGFSSGSDTGKYVTEEKQSHTGEKILIFDKKDSSVRQTASNKTVHGATKVSLDSVTYPEESKQIISSNIAKVMKDKKSEVISSETFSAENNSSNSVIMEEVRTNIADSNACKHSDSDNLSTSIETEHEELQEIIKEESNANIKTEKEILKQNNEATLSQEQCSLDESNIQELASISSINKASSDKSSIGSSEKRQVSEIATEHELLSDTESVKKLNSANEEKKKLKIDISQKESDSFEIEHGTLPKEIVERALTPVSEEKFPTYDSDVKFIDVEYVDAEQLEVTALEEELTPTVEYFYGYLPTCSPPEVTYDRRDSYFEALEILDECVSDVQKNIFENQNIYKVMKKEKSNSLTPVHENDEIEEFSDASPLKTEDELADLEDKFEEPLTENVLEQTSLNEHENEVFVLSSEEIINKTSPCMKDNTTDNIENFIFEDAIENNKHIKPDIITNADKGLKVSQKIRKTDSTDKENEVFVLSSDEITDNVITTSHESCLEITEDLVFQDAIGDTIINENLPLPDVKSDRSGDSLSSCADNLVDQFYDTDLQQIHSQKSLQHLDLNNLKKNIQNNADKSIELAYKTSDSEISHSEITENNRIDAHAKNATPLKILCENKLSQYSPEFFDPESGFVKTDDKLAIDIPETSVDSKEKISEIPSVPSDIVRYLYYDDSIQFEDDSSSSQSTCSFQTFPISAQLEIANKDVTNSDAEVPELLKESKTLSLQNVCDTVKLESSSLMGTPEVSSNTILRSDESENKQTSNDSEPVFAEKTASVASIAKIIDKSSVLDVNLPVGASNSESESIQKSLGEVNQTLFSGEKEENAEISDESKDKIFEIPPEPSDSKDKILSEIPLVSSDKISPEILLVSSDKISSEIISVPSESKDKLSSEITSVSSDSKDKILSEIPSVPSDIVRYLYYDDSIHFEDDSSKSESTCSFETSPISAQLEIADKNKMSSGTEISELLQGSSASSGQDSNKYELQEDSSNIVPSPGISEDKPTEELSATTSAERFDSVTSVPIFVDESLILDATSSVGVKQEIVSEEKEEPPVIPLLETEEEKLNALDIKVDNDEITDISTHFTMTDDSDKFSDIESDNSLTEDKCFFELDNLISDKESDVLTSQKNLDEHLIKQKQDILNEERRLSNLSALGECSKEAISEEKDVNGNITACEENLNLISPNKPLDIESIPKDQTSKCELIESDNLKPTTTEIEEPSLEVQQPSMDSNQHDISIDDKSQCQNSEYFPLTDSISSNTSKFLSMYNDNISEIKTVSDAKKVIEPSQEQPHPEISSQSIVLPDPKIPNVSICKPDSSQCADKISLEKEDDYKLENEKVLNLQVDSNNKTTFDSKDSKQQDILKDNISVLNEKDNGNFEEKEVGDVDALKSFGHLPSMSDVMEAKSISNSCNEKEMSFSVLKDNLHGEFKNEAEMKEKKSSGLDIDLVSTVQSEDCGGDNTFSFKSKMGDILGKELNSSNQDELKDDKEVVDFKRVPISEDSFLKDDESNKLPVKTFLEETIHFKDYSSESENGSLQNGGTSSCVDFKVKEINEGSDTSQTNQSIVDFKGKGLQYTHKIIKADSEQNGEESQITVDFKGITISLGQGDKANTNTSSSIDDFKRDSRHGNASEKESTKFKQLDECNAIVDFKGVSLDKNSYAAETNNNVSLGSVDFKEESQQETALKQFTEVSNVGTSDNKNNKPIASSNLPSNEENNFVDFKGCISNIENLLKEKVKEEKFSSVCSQMPDKTAIEIDKVDNSEYNKDVNNVQGTLSSYVNNSFASSYEDELSSYYSVLDNVDNTLTFTSDSEFTDSPSYVTLDDTDVTSYVSLEDTDVPSYVSFEDSDIPSYVTLEDTDFNSEAETDAYHGVDDFELDQFSMIKESTPTKESIDYSLFQVSNADSGIRKDETNLICESKGFKFETALEKSTSAIDLDEIQLVQQKIETVKSEIKDPEKHDEHKNKSDPVTNPPDSLQVDFKGSIQNNECLQTSSDFKIIENKPDETPPRTTTPILAHTEKDKDSYQMKDSLQVEFLSECNVEDQKQVETIPHIKKVSDDVEKAEIHEIDSSTQDLTDTTSFTSITDEHETFSDSEANSLIDNVVFDSINNYKVKASSTLPDIDSGDNKPKIENEPIVDNANEVNTASNKDTFSEKTNDYLLSSSSVSKEKSHASESIKSDTEILQNKLDTTNISDSLSANQNFNEVIKEISNDFEDTTTYESITDECEKLSESDLTNLIEDFPLSPQRADDVEVAFNSELTSKDFVEKQDRFLDSGVIEHSKDYPTNGNELSMQNDKKFLDLQFAGIPQNFSEDISEHMLIEHFAEIKSLGEHLNVVESFATFEGDMAIEKIHEEANEASLRIEKTQDSDYWLEADTDYSISEFEDEALSLSNKEKQSKTSSAMISALSEQKNILEVATQPSNDNTTEISVSSFFTDPEFSEHVSDTCADISLQGATTENSDKWSDIEGDGLIDDTNFNIDLNEEFDMNVYDSSNIEINNEQSFSLDECVTCPDVQEQVIDSTDEDLKVHQSKELSITSIPKVQIPSHSITAHISHETPDEAIISSIVSSSVSQQLQPSSDLLAPVSGLSDEEFTSVTPLDMTIEESDKWSDISDTSIEEMEEETASISLKASSKDHTHDMLPTDFQEVKDKNFASASTSSEAIIRPMEKCIKSSTDELNALSLQSTVEKDFTASNVISEEFKVIEQVDSPIHSSNEIKPSTGIGKEEIYDSKTPTQCSPEDLDEKEKLEDEYLEEMDEFPEEEHEYNEEIDEFAEEPHEYIEETDEFNENFEDAEIELDENGYPVLHTPYIINDDEFVYPLQYTDWIEESFDLKEYGIDTVLSGSESDVHGYGIHEEFENIERMIDLNASNFDSALDNIAEEDKTTESFKTLSNGTTSHLKVSDKEHDSWSTADAASIEDDEFPEHDDLLSRIDELLAEDFKDFHTEDDFKQEAERFVLTPSNEFVEESEPSSNLFILERKKYEDSYHDDLLSKSPNTEDSLNESSAFPDSIQLKETFDVMNLSGSKSITSEKDTLETSEKIIKKKDETKDLSHKKDKPKKSIEDMSTNLNESFSSTKDESALLKDHEESISKITSSQDSCSTKCSEVDDITNSNQIFERNKARDDSLLSEKNLSSKSIKDAAEVDKSMSESEKLKPHEEIVKVKSLNDNEIQTVVAQTTLQASVSPEEVKCVASGKAVIDINTSIESNIEMHSQEIDVKQEDIVKPDIPCKQKHKKQTIDPNKSLSSSITPSEVSSIRTEGVEIQPNIPHKTEEDSSIASINTSDINKTPTYPRRRRRQPSTEAASLSSSSESLSSCESSSSKIESSNESDHKDTSDIPSVPVRRRRSVQSPAAGPRRRSSSDNSSASSTSKSSIHSKSSPAPDLSRKRLSIDERVAKLQSEGKCSNKEAAFIAAKLIEMQFEEEDALLASKQCSSVYHAIKFLTQLCEMCNCRFPINLMASMVDCTHRACKDCLKAHFTTLIYDRSIFNLLCPICHMPDITDQNIQEYFNHLDIMLRNILDTNAYDLFQRKLRDEVLTKDPNFHWCSQCSSGFIASPRLKKLYCPDCSAITCASCHQTWELEHEGVHCERFQQWKDMHTPEPPPAGTVKFLTDRGITCPSCGLLYAQACGGCLMYKCSHCSHEFCGFCIRSFKRAKDCSEKNCLNSIIHTHHPINCLFFIRDKEISDIQMLLEEESVTYLTIPPKDQIVKSRCQVREQKLIHGIISEDRCGRDIVPYCAGLCKTHYYEYLTELLRKNKISPLSIMTSQDLQYMLRKSRVYVPEKIKGETSDDYYKRVLEAVTKTLT